MAPILTLGVGLANTRILAPEGGLPPSILTAPVVSGLNMVGETLTTTNGTYSGTPPIMFQYQWQRSTDGGSNWTIIGLDQNTYTLVTADSGALVRCVVIAFNGILPNASNFSNSINVVAQGLVNLQSYDPSKFTLVGSKISVWADQDNTKSTWVQTTDARRLTLSSGIPTATALNNYISRNIGDLSLNEFSAYVVVRFNPAISSNNGILNGTNFGDFITPSNMWRATGQQSVSYRIGHTGNRIVVMCFKRNGASTVEQLYNNRRVQILGNVNFNSQNTIIGHLMGTPAASNWTFPGQILACYIADSYHSTTDTQATINALYDKYNLSGNTNIDSMVYMGDSNTVGNSPTVSYAVALSAQLGLNYTNCGISGACLTNRGNLSSAMINRQDQMITRPGTDYISICGGTNDVHLFNAPAADIAAAYTTIMTNLQAAGQNMSRVCISSAPYQQNDANGTRLREYRDAAQAVATAFGTKFFDLYQDMFDNGGNSLLMDPLHLNTSGMTRWQNGVYAALTS